MLYGFVLENPMKNILVFMKIFTKCFVWCFWYSKWFKTLELCGVAFALKTCLKMVIGRLRPVIKLVLGFGFDFGNENQITCTRSNQHNFGNVMLCCENGCWEPILCVCRVLREKLFWVKIE